MCVKNDLYYEKSPRHATRDMSLLHATMKAEMFGGGLLNYFAEFGTSWSYLN